MRNTFLMILVLTGMMFNSVHLLAQQNKFTNHTQGGLLAYNINFDEVGWSVQTFNGVQLNSNLAIGGTAGFEKILVNEMYKYSIIPVAVGLRYDVPIPSLNKIFLAMDAGYGFAWEKKQFLEGEVKGGLRVNPEIGVKFKVGEGKTFMTFGLGYLFQQFKSEYTQDYSFRPGEAEYIIYYPIEDYLNKQDINAHRFTLKIGFGF
ncbi:hypothetical protein [Sphingobacterium daejeonense]|uniref:hypothetical protein n=1 Tax=Sphingobacterium daejeonense TaxID=371142 RepID=UPI003D314A40